MSEALKNKTLISILVASFILTSSNSMSLVNAQPIPTSLTITVPSEPQWIIFRWSSCTIEATLKDENGNPLQNMDIKFYVCGTSGSCMDWIGTGKTDSKGVASLKYTFPRGDTFNVKAIFSGTTDYAQSTSESVPFIIIDYTPYIVGGIIAAAAIIGVAGYIVSHRRKIAIAIPKKAKEA